MATTAEKKRAAKPPKQAPRRLTSIVLNRLSTVVSKPASGQFKALSEREWKFVHELVSGEGSVTLKEAGLRAGYTASSAKVMASRLTNPVISPHVVAAIQTYRHELAEKYGTTYERHMRDLQVIRDAALSAGNYGAAVQAEYRRGQALGTIYIDRKEIRHGTIDSMSREEVLRKLTELKQLYAGSAEPVSDIEFNQVSEVVPDDETGSSTVQDTEKSPTESIHHQNRESAKPGYTGPPDRFGFSFEVRNGRVEGGETGSKDQP